MSEEVSVDGGVAPGLPLASEEAGGAPLAAVVPPVVVEDLSSVSPKLELAVAAAPSPPVPLVAEKCRRVRLSEQELEAVSREQLLLHWRTQDAYIEAQAAAHQAELLSLHEVEERLKHHNNELLLRERVLVRRLAAKEQEIQEYAVQLSELKACQTPTVAALRSALLDPAVNLLIQRLRAELASTRTRLEETQNELSAWKFTPDSNTGKRLMAKCRLLYQENEELGRVISSGRLAKLEGDLALQKSFSEEVKKSQSELDEFLQDLDEDVEGMQSTIYYLQQELRKAKDMVASLEAEVSCLRAGESKNLVKPDVSPRTNGTVKVEESEMKEELEGWTSPQQNVLQVEGEHYEHNEQAPIKYEHNEQAPIKAEEEEDECCELMTKKEEGDKCSELTAKAVEKDGCSELTAKAVEGDGCSELTAKAVEKDGCSELTAKVVEGDGCSELTAKAEKKDECSELTAKAVEEDGCSALTTKAEGEGNSIKSEATTCVVNSNCVDSTMSRKRTSSEESDDVPLIKKVRRNSELSVHCSDDEIGGLTNGDSTVLTNNIGQEKY